MTIEDQPELAAPLTEQELKAGGGYGPAITSVDMTPRPRYRESQAAFEARMRSYGVLLDAEYREVKQRNRAAALRGVTASGEVFEVHGPVSARYAAQYFTVCACGWCGLRVEDPEVARREYDAHDCAAANVGQSAVDRAIAETDRVTLAKRTQHVLQPAIKADVEAPVVSTVEADGTEQRFALLELK